MLGISVYPEKSTIKKIKDYLKLANSYGFQRVFSCLLSVNKPKEEVVKEFKDWIGYANSLGMQVMLDVAPVVFERLKIDKTDLSFFKELGVYGVRLDQGFDGLTEAQLTRNPHNLFIEINLSNDVSYPNFILDYDADKNKLIGCHNFYPQFFSGLSRKYFDSCNKRFKKLGLKTAAFVSSPTATQGPWGIMDGLCTLEEHRALPITTQVKDLLTNPDIDTIIIGNAEASEKELKDIVNLVQNKVELDIIFEDKATDLDREIVLDFPHFRRGDLTEYFIRATKSRVVYKDHDSPVINTPKTLYPGDVVLGTNNIGKYKNELQIILKEQPNFNKRKRVVAKVLDYDHFLINKINAWTQFCFREIK